MIKPYKYMKVKLSLLGVSSEILKIISQEKVIKYDNLLDSLISKDGSKIKPLFLPSLSFLFLLGKISYSQKEDILKYEAK